MQAGTYQVIVLSNTQGAMDLGEGTASLEYHPRGESILVLEDGTSEAAQYLELTKAAPRTGIVARVVGDRMVPLGRVSWKSELDTGEQRYSLWGAEYLPKPGQD